MPGERLEDGLSDFLRELHKNLWLDIVGDEKRVRVTEGLWLFIRLLCLLSLSRWLLSFSFIFALLFCCGLILSIHDHLLIFCCSC